jgi:hypothetical protein
MLMGAGGLTFELENGEGAALGAGAGAGSAAGAGIAGEGAVAGPPGADRAGAPGDPIIGVE